MVLRLMILISMNKRWILTAAHCLRRKVEMGILFGSTADGIFVNGSLVPVANQHMHPLFDASSKNNDIGLYSMIYTNHGC